MTVTMVNKEGNLMKGTLKIYRYGFSIEPDRFLMETDDSDGLVLVTPGYFRIGEDYYAVDEGDEKHWLSITIREGRQEYAYFGRFPTKIEGIPYWVR